MELAPIRRIGDIQLEDLSVTVTAKVIEKSEIFNTETYSASGPFYKILISDETGTVYVFLYLHPKPMGPHQHAQNHIATHRAQWQEIADALQEGHDYTFVGRVRSYNKKFTVPTHVNGCELLLDNVIFQPSREIENATSHIPFLFYTLTNIRQLPTHTPVDILGIVGDITPHPEIELRLFVNIGILDNGAVAEIQCNVWAEQAHLFEGNPPSRVAIQGAKTTDYNDERQLHIGNTAVVYMMDTPEERQRLDPNLDPFYFDTFGEYINQ